MHSRAKIVQSKANDVSSIVAIYPQAFPDEDLVPVVTELLADRDDVLSLVAVFESQVVGHVVFTRCSVEGSGTDVALLAPLAVLPAQHRQGIGTALVLAGFEQLERAGVEQVFVLGDPAYYGRFGFQADSTVDPPYALPAEWEGAWQSRHLGETGSTSSGKLIVPRPWQHQSLWAP